MKREKCQILTFPQWVLPLQRPDIHQLRTAMLTANWHGCAEGACFMRRLSLNRSEPAKKSGHNIPKNRCRTTIAERMVETLAELPFIGDEVVCLSHDRAARSGPAAIGPQALL